METEWKSAKKASKEGRTEERRWRLDTQWVVVFSFPFSLVSNGISFPLIRGVQAMADHDDWMLLSSFLPSFLPSFDHSHETDGASGILSIGEARCSH